MVWRFQLQDENGTVLEIDLEHDYEVGRVSRVGHILRYDHEIGVGRKEGIEKFVVWPVKVALRGVGRNSGKLAKDFGRPHCEGRY